MVKEWLCGRAASGLERILCGVLMNETSRKQGEVHWLLQYNPFPNKPWFLLVCSTSLLKTLWEKVKLLETSNFSFSLSVFYLFG